MKPWQIAAALALGFLLGGFAHLWFLSDVGYSALMRAGDSGYGWNTKSVGDGIAGGTLLYLLGLSLYAATACTLVITMIAHEWWCWRSFPFRRPRLQAFIVGLAVALLSALGAVTLDQQKITENYVYYADLGEPFESRTIALALPPMQAFTADCQRILLLALLLILLVWGGEHWLRQRHRPLPTLTHLRRSGQ